VNLSRILRGYPAGWTIVAVTVLGGGYLNLWQGGTSVAAVLLVVGYLAAVPMAVRAWYERGAVMDGTAVDAAHDDAPPCRTAVGVALALLVLYAMTLAPTTAMWDTSEYIAVARVLGIPHPPGNPLFVLIAHTFALLPIPVTYAERVNLLAATTSALSAGLWCLVAHRSMRGWSLPAVPRIVAAAMAAILGATTFTVWNQSVVNEKVYTVGMLGVAIVSWLALRWVDAPAASKRTDGLFVLVVYVCALGYANHPAGFLPLPAVGALLLLRRPSTLLRWRLLLVAGFVFAVGITPFAFEPIRSAHQPPINEGNPTACLDGPKIRCTLSDTTWQRLRANIQREQYGGHAVADRQAPLGAQIGMWWEYFEWQWWRDAFHANIALQRALALLFLTLGLVGGLVHFRRDRTSFVYVASLILTVTPLLIFYLNFRYSPGQMPELADSVPREVRDRDYFFVWSFATFGLWAGLGLTALWQSVAARMSEQLPSARRWLLASPVLLVACIPLLGNHAQASRRGQTFTREWARDLLMSVEPYAVLITSGDNDSFPLWYAQQVEGVRKDVTVALVPYLGTDWYPRQLRRWRVQPYAGDGLPQYANLKSVRPTGSPLAISDVQVDAIPPYIQLPEAHEFVHSGIRATVPAGIVTRDQLMTLQMITDAFPARPIYFSIGGYAQALGLGDYVVTQGLAQRLLTAPARERPGVVGYPGGYMDLARTKELWDAFGGAKALIREGGWVDEASISIPSAYVVTSQLLGYGLMATGDSVAGKQVLEESQRLTTVLRLARPQ